MLGLKPTKENIARIIMVETSMEAIDEIETKSKMKKLMKSLIE